VLRTLVKKGATGAQAALKLDEQGLRQPNPKPAATGPARSLDR
jgi:hypothetical protein